MLQPYKNNNGHFRFKFSKKEYGTLLKKFKGNVSLLNKELKKNLFRYITDQSGKNQQKEVKEITKVVYLSCVENETIALFCNQQKTSRAKLSNQIKSKVMNSVN